MCLMRLFDNFSSSVNPRMIMAFLWIHQRTMLLTPLLLNNLWLLGQLDFNFSVSSCISTFRTLNKRTTLKKLWRTMNCDSFSIFH
uniref:Uncharacterized protein n=1 Tax=Rhizophora mucronata TaxID=61149 RepID=A0A2P2K661_RHIMU